MIRIICISLLMLVAMLPAQADDRNFHAVMAEFRPLQYTENGQIIGYSADIARELVNGLGAEGGKASLSMEMIPWKRATVMSNRGPNVLFFSIARTPEREEKYHWIGEISPYVVGFVGLRDGAKTSPNNLQDLMASGAMVAVQRASNAAAMLVRRGYIEGSDFATYNHYRDGLRMLFAQRIDAMPLTVMFYRNNACRQGLDGDQLHTLFHVQELSRPLWLVASKETAPDTVNALHQSWQNLERQGRIKARQEQYLDVWNKMDCKPENGS